MSDDGVAYLQQLEGLRLQPYPDGSGYSIGYGHFIEPGEDALMNGITQAQADSIFATDLQNVEDAVNNTITVGLTQPEFDALCMFAYNIGYTNFAGSQLAKNINAGQSDQQIRDYWLTTWVGSPANPTLVNRRQQEADYAFPDTGGAVTTAAKSLWPWGIAAAFALFLYHNH